jgi:hypothetical protein
VPLVLACSLLSSCGAGVVAVVASSGSSGGGTTPALDSFVVESPKVPRARLRLDASQAVRVGLFYDFGQGERPMSTLRDALLNEIDGNEVDLTASEVLLDWDFAAEPGGTAGFTPGVRLMAKRGGAVISGGELTLGLGNDAPEVLSIDEIDVDPDEGEASGTTGIELTVSDTSDDVVSVQVEFDIAGDVPDAGWQLARQDLLDPADPTPMFGIDHVQVASGGTQLAFHWDTDFDLKDLERDVRLRFTATDFDELDEEVDSGQPVESTVFRVDNNAPPIVQLQNDAVIANPDERRGIPIPFRVIDEEGDLVEVIFQWRHEGEEFPSLDRDGDGEIENAEVDEILADKELREQFHVCTPYPHSAQGRVVPIDEDEVRLPELASHESWILASGIVGKTLELLRPSSIPAPITPTWRSNPLVSPIAALPVGDGLTALVLDVPGNGRLREIELANGEIVREIATLSPGIPSAMAFERRERAVLVALDDAGTWRIERVELASGAITALVDSDGTEPAPVRGIASLGTNAAVFTAGTSLFHVDYRDPLAPQLGRLLTDLATPWGVVVDPLSPNRIYVSERDASRVLAIQLDSHGRVPVVVKTADMQLGTLEAPSAIALERHGSRILIVTNAPGGNRQLLGLDPGATGESRTFAIGTPTAAEVASVISGSDRLRLLCVPDANELLVAGGVEQQRTIAARSSSSQSVSVGVVLDPLPATGQPWRIRAEPLPLRARTTGAASRFLWDSTDAPGSALLRATARDDELGPAADGAAPKRVRASLDVDPLRLGPGLIDRAISVAAGDLDGDGDLDLVSANSNSNNLTIFFQLAPGTFDPVPLVLGGPGTTDGPGTVRVADLDGDADLDIVSGNGGSRNLTVFFQVSPGNFGATPQTLGGPEVTNVPASIAAADLDDDGDVDLVSANQNSNDLTLFFQQAPGIFGNPLALGGTGVTDLLSGLTAADLDGDGDMDLVSANQNGDDLTVFFQQLPGSFGNPLDLGGTGVTDRPSGVTAADLDADGDLDLVAANLGDFSTGEGKNLTVFFQLSPGSFATDPLELGLPGRLDTFLSVEAADLDGDDDLDLVAVDAQASNLVVFPQLYSGSFSQKPFVIGGPETTNSATVKAVDLDGNGSLDLVSPNGTELTVFLQRFRDLARTPVPVGGVGTLRTPTGVAAADLDGDADLDLVSANEFGRNLTVFFQESAGFAISPLVLGRPTSGFRPISVMAPDLDGDGDLDLTSGTIGGSLNVFFQLSPGNYSDSPLVLISDGGSVSPNSIAAEDLDHDGDLDLITPSADAVSIFHQVSPGNFAADPLVLGGTGTTTGPRAVAAADLDADGSVDIVSANTEGDNLAVFFQISGKFATAVSLGGPATTGFPISVAVADLDGDGALDLTSANANGGNLTVFYQSTTRTFGASPLVLGSTVPFSVAAADLDGDGDQDLASANLTEDNVTVFIQLSPRRFALAPLALGGSGTMNDSKSVVASDLDGDGETDLVSANSLSNNLSVFWAGR